MPPQYNTPKRCRIKGTIEYLNAHHIPYNTIDVIKFHGDSKTQGYETLKGADRTRHNDSNRPIETRGRKNKLTSAQIAHDDQIIEENELEMEGKSST